MRIFIINSYNCGCKKIFCGKFDILVYNLNLMQRCVRSHPELLCMSMYVCSGYIKVAFYNNDLYTLVSLAK